MFTDKNLWTSENVGQLMKHFVENLDEGAGSFMEKLEEQLRPASGSAKQLAAEMLWVMYLYPVPTSMRPGTKRQQIRQVWEWSGEPLPDARFELQGALDPGIGTTGTAYNVQRWKEFRYFVLMLQEWTRLTESQREGRLRDPWAFAAWLEDRDETRSRQLRHVLLYLLFPTRFEPFATASQKEAIARAFTKELGEDPDAFNYGDRIDLDRSILAIRERLEERDAAPGFDFHDEPYLKLWRPDHGSLPSPEESKRWYREKFGAARVWALAPGAGAMHWAEFQEKGIIAIGWDALGDLGAFTNGLSGTGSISKELIYERLRELLDRTNPVMDSLACYQFAHEMKPGDHVVVKQGVRLLLGHGVIESHYEFDASRPEFKHVRRVRWEKTGRWRIPKKRQITPKTLTDFSPYKEWLHFAFQRMEGPEPSPSPLPPIYTSEQSLQDLFLAETEFDRIRDSLSRKKNIVLEGPPGVGKTFIAKRLAYRTIGYELPERVRMVQFHQSYSYEDFVQGYRPREAGGFALRDGVFFSFCREAAANPDDRYVFIIDEVNRGNLSKIFGELMMLLEADKRGPEYAVPLTYSPEAEPFHVPANLYLIAMMNTADRSLAMVDYALRRRFAFIRLRPAFRTDEFSNFLIAAGVPEETVTRIVDRLSRLNETIRADRRNLGPGFEIGHSFFCPGDDDQTLDESWYEAIVRREVEPLLGEYWFDDPERVDKEVQALLA